MKNKLTFLIANILFLTLCFTPAHARKKSLPKTPPTKVNTYTYTDRHFSYSLPLEWTVQNGDVNSDRVLFIAQPLTRTCSFEVNISLMQPDFNAEESITSALKTLKQSKNKSAKRRDEFGLVKGKSTKFARGWETVEKAQNGYQRIVYQAYDRENYSLYFAAGAEAAQFEKCRPELQRIINSIQFGD